MKNLNNKKIFVLMIMLSVLLFQNLFSTKTVYAEDYTLLAPLPCVGGDCAQTAEKTTLEKYIPGLFKLLIGLSAVFAVLMIVIGGFQYISSDALQKKSDGKNRIQNSIWGLVLVISAWLILNTINPKLLNFNLNLESVGISPIGAGGTAAGFAMTPEQITESNDVRASLESKGVLTYADPCKSGQTTQCVNLNGLTSGAQDGVIAFKKACNCSVTITGGTEPGHSEGGGHPAGTALDLRSDSGILAYVEANKTSNPVQTSLGPLYQVKVGGTTYKFLKESDHWHVNF